ncbi:unnamed protein product [Durusdinium trenchii]|uniref:Uncharacterized protein n=1 Tax=Durusdinium trenchii TaxID=1381693 RepID=A0ABP0RWD5_9DINO
MALMVAPVKRRPTSNDDVAVADEEEALRALAALKFQDVSDDDKVDVDSGIEVLLQELDNWTRRTRTQLTLWSANYLMEMMSNGPTPGMLGKLVMKEPYEEQRYDAQETVEDGGDP